MPGMEKAEGELKGAAARMRQAQEMLRRDESKGAAAAERDAADRLAKLRDSMQERPMGGSRQPHEPVRIPGADESSAPRAWRQELLDAMKEKAPERFRDEVRRYYEELVQDEARSPQRPALSSPSPASGRGTRPVPSPAQRGEG